MRPVLSDSEIRKNKIDTLVFRLVILTSLYVSIVAVAVGAVLFAIASQVATAGSDGVGWVVLLVGFVLILVFSGLARFNFKKKDELLATI